MHVSLLCIDIGGYLYLIIGVNIFNKQLDIFVDNGIHVSLLCTGIGGCLYPIIDVAILHKWLDILVYHRCVLILVVVYLCPIQTGYFWTSLCTCAFVVCRCLCLYIYI